MSALPPAAPTLRRYTAAGKVALYRPAETRASVENSRSARVQGGDVARHYVEVANMAKTDLGWNTTIDDIARTGCGFRDPGVVSTQIGKAKRDIAHTAVFRGNSLRRSPNVS